MVEKGGRLSIKRQCELLSVSRRSFYYRPKGENNFNKELMKLLEEQYMKDPTCGSRKLTIHLKNKGYKVNRKRIQRLMRKMGIMAIYQAPRTSIPSKESIYTENLLRKICINSPNKVWYTDITYVKVSGGFCYTVAIMDAYSKKVLSMRHSNTLDRFFCVAAAQEAVKKYGYPKIIHSDKGKQFLSKDFLEVFSDKEGKITCRSSFGERGYRDNIYIERFWRTYKYECLNLHDTSTLKDVKEISQKWLEYYNKQRPHQSLNYKTPDEVYYENQNRAKNGKKVV